MKFAGIIAAGTAAALYATAANAQVVGIGSTKGTAVAQITAAIAKVVSSHSGMQMRTQAMGGTQQYIPVVNAGQLEFGISNLMQAYMALTGTGMSEGHKYENLRMVATMMTFRNGAIVRNDSDIQTPADLKGKRVPYGFNSAPLFKFFIDATLANGGLTADDVVKVPAIGLSQSWELMKQGKIDVAITTTGAGPTAEMDTRISSGIRFIDFEDEGERADKVQEFLPKIYFVPMDPSMKLPGIRKPVDIYAYDYMLWCNKDVPNDVVAKVAKAMHDHADELKASAKLWVTYDPANMGKDHGDDVPYHPGAIEYYKKIGIWKR